jgi:hypothetical protein
MLGIIFHCSSVFPPYVTKVRKETNKNNMAPTPKKKYKTAKKEEKAGRRCWLLAQCVSVEKSSKPTKSTSFNAVQYTLVQTSNGTVSF